MNTDESGTADSRGQTPTRIMGMQNAECRIQNAEVHHLRKLEPPMDTDKHRFGRMETVLRRFVLCPRSGEAQLEVEVKAERLFFVVSSFVLRRTVLDWPGFAPIIDP